MMQQIQTHINPADAIQHGKTRFGQSDRINYKTEWITPFYITSQFPIFDLDPCAPIRPPHMIAEKHYHLPFNGLVLDWHGRVWLNPPYDHTQKQWLQRMAAHNNGIALLNTNCETKYFQQHVFPFCSGIYFIAGRIKFLNIDGEVSTNTAQVGSCLVSYGKTCRRLLENINRDQLPGWLCEVKR